MGMLGLFCFKVILAEILMVQVMPEKSEGSELTLLGLRLESRLVHLGLWLELRISPLPQPFLNAPGVLIDFDN